MTGIWLLLVLFVVTVVARVGIAKARTGDAGIRVGVGSMRGWAAVAVAAMVGGWCIDGAGVVAAAVNGAAPTGVVRAVGVVAFAAGLVLMVWAQLAMGASWRIGVDPEERTELVARGPFRVVRNPIYSAMVVTLLGIGLVARPWVAVCALVVFAAGVEVQARWVEEPYLAATHPEFDAYRSRVGRFVPGLGRFTTP